MKNIAFIMPTLLPMPPVKGGAVETLVNGLLTENEKQDSVDFHVYCIYDSNAEKAAKNYKHVTFHTYRLIGANIPDKYFAFRALKKIITETSYIFRILKDLKHRQWDAVISENNTYFAYTAAKKLKDTPVYAHIHNDITDRGKIFLSGIAKYCTGTIAISEYVKRRMMTVKGTAAEKIKVVPNGIDIQKFNAGQYSDFRKDFRSRHNISDDDIVFMFAGRVIPEKGVFELARAFAKLRDKNTRLMIVGGRWFSEDVSDKDLDMMKHELRGVTDRVIFTGYVPFEEMPKYYACADVAVLPSICNEAASLTLIESFASGLPAITTDAGGIAETANSSCAFVLERGDGLADDIAECMHRLAAEPELRKKMSECAEKRVEGRDYGEYFKSFISAVTG